MMRGSQESLGEKVVNVSQYDEGMSDAANYYLKGQKEDEDDHDPLNDLLQDVMTEEDEDEEF